MASNFQSLALSRYPNNSQMRADYIRALEECRLNPAYYVDSIYGRIPCACYPLMPDDNKGWTVVKRKVRVKRVKTAEELDEEADIDNWDNVEHYGRVTYTSGPVAEHNGSLFDIGSRF
jgi:hypothetical protein